MADLVIDAFVAASLSCAVELTVYCLMPDHVHMLLTAEADSSHVVAPNIRRTIEAAKQRSGFRYAHSRKVPLWQPSYFDRSLRPGEGAVPVVAYILDNPVRAGFVSAPDTWPFIGSSRWSRDELLEFVGTERGGFSPR